MNHGASNIVNLWTIQSDQNSAECRSSLGWNQGSLGTETCYYNAKQSSSKDLWRSVAKKFLQLSLADRMPLKQVLYNHIKHLYCSSHINSLEIKKYITENQISGLKKNKKGIWASSLREKERDHYPGQVTIGHYNKENYSHCKSQ